MTEQEKALWQGSLPVSSLRIPMPSGAVMPPQRRDSGRTTQQIREAPQGAIFVWCTPTTDYTSRLAARLNRSDLVLIGSDGLRSRNIDRLRGRDFPALVIDHTLRDGGLDPEQ